MCDRCKAVTGTINALCDTCGALNHQPDCDNLGWGHAAYCRCNNPEATGIGDLTATSLR